VYEHQTFETILQRMLARVPNDIDKWPGGVIYDALAPAAAELAQLYAELDINLNLSFADTASGEYLSRRAAEFGVIRRPATKARRQGLFYGADDTPMDVSIGSRFSIDGVNYAAISRIAAGVYTLECETAGTVGNQHFGALLPITFVPGLSRAELGAVLVPGEDEEDDESLRQRYYAAINEPAFGGNVADYKQKIGVMEGVGGVKVFPVWQGGGTVKCTIIASDWSAPSQQLVDEVQNAIDPPANSGQGYGLAPIGHHVTIAGVLPVTIDVATTVTLADGVTVGQIQGPIEEVIDAYLLGLRRAWVNEPQLVVRISQIEAAILTVPGVVDVTGTTLNGSAANVTLDAEEIPVLGTVVINE
jgi:uncharacterized phage protein gp47/JayE